MSGKMEPERQIEKLLRDAAKKRREQSPDSELQLHPATRRLLQNEIARHRAKPAEAGLFQRMLSLLRPKYMIYAAGCAALVILFGVFMHPSGSSRKEVANRALEERDAENLDGLKASPPAAANEPMLGAASSPQKTVPATLSGGYGGGGGGGAPGEGQRTGTTYPVSVVGYVNTSNSPADSRISDLAGTAESATNLFYNARASGSPIASRESSPASPQVQPMGQTGPGIDVALNEKRRQQNPYDNVAGAVGGNITNMIATANFVAAKQAPISQQFYRTDVQLKKSISSPVISVLSKFQWRQDGNQLQLQDEDGSIYNGTLQSANDFAAQTALQNNKLDQPQKAASFELKSGLQQNQAPEQNNLSFRVTGMNNSIGANVVFTGNLVSFTNSMQNYLANQSKDKAFANMANSQAQQLSLSNSSISGTAIIGGSNEIQINAMPAPP